MGDELDDYIKQSAKTLKTADRDDEARAKIRQAAALARAKGLNVGDDIADDFYDLTKHESGRAHFLNDGKTVKTGVRTPDGDFAIGFSQVMGNTAKPYKAKGLDPYKEIDNIAIGLHEFAEGDRKDPIARRLAYVGGSKSAALAEYRRTGKVSDKKLYSYLPNNKETYADYVEKSGGFAKLDNYIKNSASAGSAAPITKTPEADPQLSNDSLDAYIKQSANDLQQATQSPPIPDGVLADTNEKRRAAISGFIEGRKSELKTATDPKRIAILKKQIAGAEKDLKGIPVQNNITTAEGGNLPPILPPNLPATENYIRREIKPGDSYYEFEKTGKTERGEEYLGMANGSHRFKNADGDEFELDEATKQLKPLGATKRDLDADGNEYVLSSDQTKLQPGEVRRTNKSGESYIFQTDGKIRAENPKKLEGVFQLKDGRTLIKTGNQDSLKPGEMRVRDTSNDKGGVMIAVKKGDSYEIRPDEVNRVFNGAQQKNNRFLPQNKSNSTANYQKHSVEPTAEQIAAAEKQFPADDLSQLENNGQHNEPSKEDSSFFNEKSSYAADSDEEILSKGSAGNVSVDLSQRPKGANAGRWLLKQALRQVAPKYGLTNEEIDASVGDKAKGEAFYDKVDDGNIEQVLESLKGRAEGNTLVTVHLTNQNINDILQNRTNGNPSEINPALRNIIDLEENTLAGGLDKNQSNARVFREEETARRDLTESALKAGINEDGSLSMLDADNWKLAIEKLLSGELQAEITKDERERVVLEGVEELIRTAGSARRAAQLQREYAEMDGLEKTLAHIGDFASTIARFPASFAHTAAWFEDTAAYIREKTGYPTLTGTDVLNAVDWVYAKSFNLKEKPQAQGTLPTLLAEAIEKGIPDDPRTAQSFAGKLSRAVGSAVPFLIGAVASGGSSAVIGILGIGSQSGEMYKKAKESGLSREKQILSGLAGVPLGLSELTGLKWARLGQLISNRSKGVFLKSFTHFLYETGKEASEETLQEFFQSSASDLTIEALKKNGLTRKDIAKAAGGHLEDALTAGIVGAIFGGGVPLSAKLVAYAEDKTANQYLTDNAIDEREAESAELNLPVPINQTKESAQTAVEPVRDVLEQKPVKTDAQTLTVGQTVEVKGIGQRVVREDRGDKILVSDEEGNRVRVVNKKQILETQKDNDTKTQIIDAAAAEPAAGRQPVLEDGAGNNQTDGEKPANGRESSAVSHPNPDIDGKPIIAETKEGKSVVANPNNKSGVSVVQNRAEKPTARGLRFDSPEANVESEKVNQNSVKDTLEPETKLKENEKTKHDFSSTQVNLPSEESEYIKVLGKRIIDNSDLAKVDWNPREENPHITVKYGLHTDDAATVRKILENQKPFEATLGKTSIFPAKEGADYDVVKIDVDSPELHRINKLIAESTKVTDTHPTYQPHVTLAYVKAGSGQKYVGANSFEGKKFKFDSIVFSDKNGNPVEIPLSGKANSPDKASSNKPDASSDSNFTQENSNVKKPAENYISENNSLKKADAPSLLVREFNKANAVRENRDSFRNTHLSKSVRIGISNVQDVILDKTQKTEPIFSEMDNGNFTAVPTKNSEYEVIPKFDTPINARGIIFAGIGNLFELSGIDTSITTFDFTVVKSAKVLIKRGKTTVIEKGIINDGKENYSQTESPDKASSKTPNASNPPGDNVTHSAGKTDKSNIFDEEFDAMFGADTRAQLTEAQEKAKSAIAESKKGLESAGKALIEMFNPESFKSAMMPAFDEKTYEKAKPHFVAAISHFKTAGMDSRAAIKSLLKYLSEELKASAETVLNMKPYILRFVEDLDAGKIDLQSEANESITESEEQKNDVEHDKFDRDSQTGDGRKSAGNVRGTEGGGNARTDSLAEGAISDRSARRDDSRLDDESGDLEQLTDAQNSAENDGQSPSRRNGDSASDRISTRNSGKHDYLAPVGSLTREGSWRETAKTNLDILELVKRLESENRLATPEEQKLLVKFTGWGASEIANNLFPGANYGTREILPERARDGWQELARRAKDLFTPEELKTALASTQNAHYTSEKIVRGIWNALTQFGFRSGSVLEPGMGVGLFAAAAPKNVIENSRYTGIERDKMTAAIAKQVLQNQAIIEGDYVKQKLPNDFFDVAIGNPPFASVKILDDPAYKKYRFMLHDYFFAKSIDKVRPGGLLVFVTSKGTMDKADQKMREYIAERADLLGAIRLPQTAFKQNAGTEVVTDVIFLRKRAEGEQPAGKKWIQRDEIEAKNKQDETVKDLINEYFVAHPEMVLGKHSFKGSMYKANEYTVEPAEGDIEELFQKAVEKLPTAVYASIAKTDQIIEAAAQRDWDPKAKKEGSLYVHDDGRLMRREDGSGRALIETENLSAKNEKWLKGYVNLRDALKQAQFDQLNNGDWEKSLAALNKVYDDFVKRHGNILAFTTHERTKIDEDGKESVESSRRLVNQRVLSFDIESPLIEALERITEDGQIVKSATLTKRTINRPAQVEIKTLSDALAVSLDKLGTLNLAHVTELIQPVQKMTRDEVIEELGEAIFELPGGNWQMADEYLSGFVVDKLEEAEAAAAIEPRFERNVKALLAVQPKPLETSQISVGLGAAWIPQSIVSDFASETLGFDKNSVEFDSLTNIWTVEGAEGAGSRGRRQASAEWGTAERSPQELLDAALNNKSIKIYDRRDKKQILNEGASAKANDIVKKMRDRFRGWIWTDAKRAQNLTEKYNRQFNNIAPRKLDGSHLTLPGLSAVYKLHDHQKRAVWRILQTGNTYLAHAVGAGKTLEMIVSGMEQRRLGLIKKPMYVVPRHMLKQFASEFLDAYPMANILVADEKNFAKENRRRFVAQAALNDLDAIIIPHTAFGLIRTRKETSDVVVQDMISQLQEAINEVDDSYRSGERTIKKLEARIETIERRFSSKTDESNQDNVVDFEDLGVDFLYVDEAHEFRKLDFVTNRDAVKGVTPEGSRRALDLLIKLRWLEKQRPGRSAVLASGTPITNTLAELYSIMRFLDPAELEAAGLSHFDAWAAQFGEVVGEYEMNAAGKYELVERFSRFINIPELMKRARKFMDVLTLGQLGSLVDLPTVKGGAPEVVIVPASEDTTNYLKTTLDQRIKKSREWKPSKDQPGNPDPLINIITDGRLSAIDMRFVDPHAKNDPKSKLNVMIDGIIEKHKEYSHLEYRHKLTGATDPVKGAAQIVFSAVGFGEQVAASRGFDAKKWMLKRLTEAGIPASEIAFMSDYQTAAAKENMFAEMRQGTKRILVGSPKNMGTGVNVQKRLKTLWFLSPPWYPADVEQPDGRIIRQGNQNEEIEIYRLATKGTYDSTAWSMIARKSRAIEQAMTGDDTQRSLEDITESSHYEMASALAAGDARAIQLAGLRREIERLERLKDGHIGEQRRLKDDLRRNGNQTQTATKKLQNVIDAIKLVGNYVSNDDFHVSAGGNGFEKRAEIGDALKKSWSAAVKKNKSQVIAERASVEVEIGKALDKFPIVIRINDSMAGIESRAYLQMGEVRKELTDDWIRDETLLDSAGLATRVYNALNNLSKDRRESESAIDSFRRELKQIEAKNGKPFAEQQELYDRIAEYAQLQKEMAEDTGGAESVEDSASFLEALLVENKTKAAKAAMSAVLQNREKNNPQFENQEIEPFSLKQIEPDDTGFVFNGIRANTEPLALDSAAQRKIQTKTISEVTKNTDEWINRYYEKFGKTEISADNAKELFKEYRDDRLANSQGVHKASSILAYLLFRIRLKELSPGSLVYLTAGGAGSGKSYTTQNLDADLIFDIVMRDRSANRAVIDDIIDSGHTGEIYYITRSIEEAAESNLERSKRVGRLVPLQSLADGHLGSQQAFIEDTNSYARQNGFKIHYLENATGKPITELSFEEFKERAYSSYEEVFGRARKASYEELERNQYDDETRRELEGQARGTVSEKSSDGNQESERNSERESSASRASAEQDSEEPNSLKRAEPGQTGFYSQLEQVIHAKMPARATAAQIRGILNNPQSGIKQAELDWLDFDSFLKEKDKFTRTEVIDFVRANNLEIVEQQPESLKYSDHQLGGERSNEREIFLTAPNVAEIWTDGHAPYDSIQNPVIRLRVHDRTEDGTRILHVDEFQTPKTENFQNMPPALQKHAYQIGVKYALRLAAEGGYAKLTWTTGAQQTERSNLQHRYNQVNYRRAGFDGDKYAVKFFDKKGNPAAEAVLSENEIARFLGKKAANKIIETARAQPKVLEKEDLRSGEGLPNLYDNVLPNLANRIIKRFGGRVGALKLLTGTDKNETGFERVHSIDVTPEMRASVLEGQPLFRTEENSGEEFLNVKFASTAEIAAKAEIIRDGDRIKGNLEAQEILRRAKEELDIQSGKLQLGSERYESSFSGIFYRQPVTEKLVKILRDVASEGKENFPAESKTFANLADEIEAAAKAGKGTAVFYMYDNRLRHEVFHQASYLASLAKALTARHAKLAQLKAHAVFSKISEYLLQFDEYRALQATSPEMFDAVAIDEAGAYIEGGERELLNVSVKHAASFINLFYDSFVEQNAERDSGGNITAEAAAKALESFEKVQGENNEQIQKVVEAFRQRQQARNEKDISPKPGQNTGGAPESDGETSSENGKRKLRSLPGTLRSAGIDAEDQLYDVLGDSEARANAARLLEGLGVGGAMKLLKTTAEPDAVHAQLGFMVAQILQTHALEIETTDPDEARNTREIQAELTADLSRKFTKAGQFVSAARVVQNSATATVLSAQAIVQEANGADKSLTAEEIAHFEELGRKSERAFAELADARRRLINEKAKNRRLNDRLEGKTKRRTRASKIARVEVVDLIKRKHASDISKKIAGLREKLAVKEAVLMRIEETAENRFENYLKRIEEETFDRETIADLAEVGAMHLIEGIAGSEEIYLPDTFFAEMTGMFGDSIKPVMNEIYYEAMRVRNNWLKEIAFDRMKKSFNAKAESDEGKTQLEQELGRALESEDLSDEDVYEILNARRDVRRKRNAIERMHRLASGFTGEKLSVDELQKFGKRKAGKAFTTDEMTQTIVEIAPNEQVAVAAKIFADGAGKTEFYEKLKKLGIDRKTSENLFVSGQEMLKEAKALIEANHAEVRKEIAKSSKTIESIDDLIFASRLKAQAVQKEISEEFKRLKSNKLNYYGRRFVSGLSDLLRDLNTTGELSFAMKQAGRFVVGDPFRIVFNTISSVTTGGDYETRDRIKDYAAMWATIPRTLFGGVKFADLYSKAGWHQLTHGDKGFGRVVQAIERHPLFGEAQKMKVSFSAAGKIGTGGTFGEEQLHSGLAHKIMPIRRFDHSMSAMLDWLRMETYARMSLDLKAQGLTPQKNKSEFESIAREVNRGTGRANKFENAKAAQAAVDFVSKSNLAFAANYTVSKFQMLGADASNLTVSVANLVRHQRLPVGARRVEVKNAFFAYTALMTRYALLASIGLALGATVSFDPDDDDFLKWKLGKYRYDLTLGFQSELRFITRLMMSAARGNRVPNEVIYDFVTISVKYARNKLNVLPQFGLSWLTGKDAIGKDFSVSDWSRWVKLFVPITYGNFVEAYNQDGATGIVGELPEIIGVGTSIYDDRVEEAKTDAEKLALKIKQMKKSWFSPAAYKDKIDDETWKKVSLLKARSRAGEDVRKEIAALRNQNKISDSVVKDVLGVKNVSMLEELIDDARMSDSELESLRQVADADESVLIDKLLKKKAANKQKKEAKSLEPPKPQKPPKLPSLPKPQSLPPPR